jgi:hypothetical protein
MFAHTIPDVCIWGTHLAGDPKQVKLGDKIVPRYGPHKGSAFRIVRIECREELYKGAPIQFYSLYGNRLKT